MPCVELQGYLQSKSQAANRYRAICQLIRYTGPIEVVMPGKWSKVEARRSTSKDECQADDSLRLMTSSLGNGSLQPELALALHVSRGWELPQIVACSGRIA
jgi:hypothetical protein